MATSVAVDNRSGWGQPTARRIRLTKEAMQKPGRVGRRQAIVVASAARQWSEAPLVKFAVKVRQDVSILWTLASRRVSRWQDLAYAVVLNPPKWLLSVTVLLFYVLVRVAVVAVGMYSLSCYGD